VIIYYLYFSRQWILGQTGDELFNVSVKTAKLGIDQLLCLVLWSVTYSKICSIL